MLGKGYSRNRVAYALQGSIDRIADARGIGTNLYPVLAKVQAVYSDRMTCDVMYEHQSLARNVPILTKCGLIDDEVYGELDLPEVEDTVIVMFIFGMQEYPIIVGTFYPYLNSKFQASQVPVNSGSKAFTKKILEEGKDNTYRKVFKSGATVEVDEDGHVIIEAPDGSYIEVDATAGTINLSGDTKSLVTHAELDTALQTFMTALNTHIHGGVSSGGASTAIPTQMSLDISGAEAAKVKTS